MLKANLPVVINSYPSEPVFVHSHSIDKLRLGRVESGEIS